MPIGQTGLKLLPMALIYTINKKEYLVQQEVVTLIAPVESWINILIGEILP